MLIVGADDFDRILVVASTFGFLYIVKYALSIGATMIRNAVDAAVATKATHVLDYLYDQYGVKPKYPATMMTGRRLFGIK